MPEVTLIDGGEVALPNLMLRVAANGIVGDLRRLHDAIHEGLCGRDGGPPCAAVVTTLHAAADAIFVRHVGLPTDTVG